jgi:hypothetical protein
MPDKFVLKIHKPDCIFLCIIIITLLLNYLQIDSINLTQWHTTFLTYEDNAVGVLVPLFKVISNYHIEIKIYCNQYYLWIQPHDNIFNNG